MKRDDNVLALSHRNGQEMIFAFRSKHIAALVALFAIGLGAAVWVFGDEIKEAAVWAYWFAGFLFGAMVIGVVTSLTTRKSLLIDEGRKVVEFRAQSLFGRSRWDKAFREFKEIRIYRPKAGTGAGRSGWLKLLLVSKDGEEIPLGTSFLGIFGAEQARRLADELASMLSLHVIEEPSTEWQ